MKCMFETEKLKSHYFCPKCKKRMLSYYCKNDDFSSEARDWGYGDSATDHCENCKTAYQLREI